MTQTAIPSELVDTLRGIVGAEQVLTHDDPKADLTAWEQDWRGHRRGTALAVVRPASTEEVALVVAACAAAGTSIVPQGGNTGLVDGSTPDDTGTQLVLSLARMNAVRAIDPANLTVTVEAGCILQNLQDACEKAGFLFPLSLAAEGSCTIGGNLGTNAGGTQVVRYGNTRELCLGLEVVTASGEVWNGLAGLRKDNTGYDLRHLFIGSEGTLGVITAATMKLYPLPAARLTAWASAASLYDAVKLLGLAHAYLGAGLTGFEVMGRFALQLTAKHFPDMRIPLYENENASWCVLLENSDHESDEHARRQFERLLEAALEKGCVSDAVVAESIAQAQALWQVREHIPLAQAQEGLNIKHDVSIPISLIPEFCAKTDAELTGELAGARLVVYGHLGDGNLHYNVQAPDGQDAKAFMKEHEARVNDIVYESVSRFAGSISAEHGVGSMKVEKLEHFKAPVALAMMRSIKQALDPRNLMNPGRVVRMPAPH
ncbi:MAG: FAD-binding oxidoreductase [Burkholderiales bacterium]